MTFLEIVLLVLIFGYCAYILFAKKKRGCGGNCGSCQGCAHREKK